MASATPESGPAPPKRLGRYEIVGPLGKGAMGVVYEGRDPNIGRRVAIKTARREALEESGRGDEMRERFLREAHAAGALNHPHIVTVYDADEQEGMAYIAMELLGGGDLKRRMGDQTLSVEEAVNLLAQLCEALAYAHANGVVHRDVKPANVMFTDDGVLKVADFGIAHVTGSELTRQGALIGTPYYMSPEQFMGRGLDGRSDLFSAGVIGYEMLTGERPFTGEAVSTIMHHVIKTDPAAPHDLNVEVPQALSVVLMRALCKRPADRYADGREMAAALRDALSDEAATRFAATAPSRSAADEPTLVSEATAVAAATRPETPAPDSVPPPTQTGPGATARGQRRQALAAGIAAALMALAGGIATLWALGRPPAPDRSPEAPPNPVAGGPYFEAVTVSVAAYASADDALLGGNPDPRYPDPAVFLTVWDGDGTGLVESVRTTSGERVVLPEDVHPAVIAYEAASAKPGYEPVAAEGRFEALEPGATARVDIRLVPEG